MSHSTHKFMLALVAALFFVSGCATVSPEIVDEDYNAAKIAYNDGNFKGAISQFQDFIEKKPNSPLTEVAKYYLAESYYQTGDKDNAKSTYQGIIDTYKSGFWVDMAKRELKEKNLK